MADHIFAAFNNVNILDVHLSTVLAYVGLSFVVYKSLCLVLYIAHIVRTFGLARLGLGFNLDVRKFGTWAVVTGGTDGIGKAYAEQLAEKGMSIVLVSRSAEKLKNVAEEIESKYTVPTKTITIDFTTEDMESYRHVSNELEGLDIGVLVNNVGMVYKMFGRLLEQDDREQLFPDIIKCNVVSVNMMTNIVLPGMLIRKRGAVINISSGSAYVPVPALSVYSATKAYVDVFTRALQTEYQSSGVIFQAVLPFLVATNMSKIKPNGHFIPSAGAYVRSCLATLGNESRTAGYIMHEIQKLIVTSLPEGFYKRQMFQQIVAARKQYLAYRNKRDK